MVACGPYPACKMHAVLESQARGFGEGVLSANAEPQAEAAATEVGVLEY